MANLVARKSKDPSSMVGSVIVKDKRILSSGYNGFCIGVEDREERYNDRPVKYSFVAHSEFNACIVAAKFGININGSVLYTQALPCDSCAKAIIQSGITTVNILKKCEDIWHNYNSSWQDSQKNTKIMFAEAGISVVEHDLECSDEILVGGKIYKI